MLSNTNIPISSDLSARALKCALTHSLAIINSHISTNKKYEYVRSKLIKDGKRTRSISIKIKNHPISFPNLNNINPELNSICANYIDNPDTISHFDGLLILTSLGKKYGKIIIPINHTKYSRKLQKISTEQCNSFELHEDSVCFRYRTKFREKKTEGTIVGIDTGINTCISMSDKQVTISCHHGHDIHSITEKLSKKQKGSKAYWRAKEHQKNYIHWAISNLDFSGIKEVRLEKIEDFRKGKSVGKFLNMFCHRMIEETVVEFCNRQGVLVRLQNSSYRSQRCSNPGCGYVYRGNRKGKNFRCKHCNYTTDADYSSSCNHEIDLPDISYLRYLSNKPSKFFWKIEGVYDLRGQEFTVPDTQKIIKGHK